MKTTETTKRSEAESLSALVAKAKTGDQEAFSELYNKTSAELYRSIRAMTRDEDLSWDIQQDSYLRAFQSLDKLENDEAFLPWLRRIAANVTATKMSKRLPVTFTDLAGDSEDAAIPELPDLNPASQPELSLDRKETSRLVQEILSKLPEGQQMILGMRYYDELSVKEIAQLLKLSDGTVKAALFQGRKKVETAVRALEKQGVKLYGLSPVAFLVALMRRMEPAASASVKQAAVKAAVAKGTVDAVASAAVPVAAKTFGQVLAGRLLAGALAVALIGGGIWGGAKLLKSSNTDAPYQPTTSVTDERLAGVETPEELTATNEDLPVVTEPVATEPVATEPTEPSAPTEPTNPSESTEPTEPSEQPERLADHCGENLTWSYDLDRHKLTIQGSGPMYDYDNAADRAPWYEYHDSIYSIDFPAGLTTIGSYAFCDCTKIYAYSDSSLPNGLSSIGRGAFMGCTGIERILLPEGLTSVADSAFSGCSGMYDIWVMNPSCRIDADQGSLSNVTVCAYPGSAAEQFAQENGCVFSAMVVDQNAVVERLKQPCRNFVKPDWFVKVDTRYLVKVVENKPLVVTEADIQQARQNGSIILAGTEYRYTESKEEAEEWGNRSLRDDGEGWLLVSRQTVLTIVKTDDGFVFAYSGLYPGDQYLSSNSKTIIGWIWFDADTSVDDLGEISSFAEFAVQSKFRDDPDLVCPNFVLELLSDGEIGLHRRSAGLA
jgi:RNA polymerase sigma factor (sigma-70 family)